MEDTVDKDRTIRDLRAEIEELKIKLKKYEKTEQVSGPEPPAKRSRINVEGHNESGDSDIVPSSSSQNEGNSSIGAGKVLDNQPVLYRRGKKKAIVLRPFDFSKYPKRHIAVKIVYLGWDLGGFATSIGEDGLPHETVEKELFEALSKTRLIESISKANYHRCGRTDAGVSAFAQVISLDVRCNSNSGLGVIPIKQDKVSEASKIGNSVNNNLDLLDSELDYCKMLNGVLPPEIRAYAWSPVRNDFSARFNCRSRTYRYYFPTNDLNLEDMKKAASFLIGEHDYKNFCKIDRSKNSTSTTMRRILNVQIVEIIEKSSSSLINSIAFIEIKGSAFLWHQIRYIIGLLILIGRGLEEPNLINELLDPKTLKPQYGMAFDYPLVLFDTQFDSNDVQWRYDDSSLLHSIRGYKRIFLQHQIKEHMVNQMIDNLKLKFQNDKSHNDIPTTDLLLITGFQHKVYRKILDRPKCLSMNSY